MGQHCPFTLVVCLLSYTGGMALEGLCQCPPAGDCFIAHLHDEFHTHHFLRAYFPSQCLFSFSALACCPSICPDSFPRPQHLSGQQGCVNSYHSLYVFCAKASNFCLFYIHLSGQGAHLSLLWSGELFSCSVKVREGFLFALTCQMFFLVSLFTHVPDIFTSLR